jgi:uncharacterized protein YkwD
MMVAVLALSLSLTACDPQSLVSTFFEFFSGSGLQAPAAEAPEADDTSGGDDAAADDATGDGAAGDDAAGDDAADDDAAERYHHRKDDGAADEADADDADDAPAPEAPDAAEAPAPDAADAAGDAAGGLSAIEQEIFDTLNETRADAGLDALALTADIAAGSREYACTMAETGVFEHADLEEAGVFGENIAAGQRSAAEVHEGWMNSPGHRDNRMNSRWTEYGVGACEDDGGRRYYTERFR